MDFTLIVLVISVPFDTLWLFVVRLNPQRYPVNCLSLFQKFIGPSTVRLISPPPFLRIFDFQVLNNSGLHFCRKGDSLNRSWKLIFKLHVKESPPTSFALDVGQHFIYLHTVGTEQPFVANKYNNLSSLVVHSEEEEKENNEGTAKKENYNIIVRHNNKRKNIIYIMASIKKKKN